MVGLILIITLHNLDISRIIIIALINNISHSFPPKTIGTT